MNTRRLSAWSALTLLLCHLLTACEKDSISLTLDDDTSRLADDQERWLKIVVRQDPTRSSRSQPVTGCAFISARHGHLRAAADSTALCTTGDTCHLKVSGDTPGPLYLFYQPSVTAAEGADGGTDLGAPGDLAAPDAGGAGRAENRVVVKDYIIGELTAQPDCASKDVGTQLDSCVLTFLSDGTTRTSCVTPRD